MKLRLRGTDEATIATQQEALREQRRAYERSHGRLAEDMERRLEAAVAMWREQLRALVREGVPEHLHHPNFGRVAALCSMIQAATGEPVDLRAIYAQLAADGTWDATPRAEIDAQRAAFAREQRSLALAAEEAQVAEQEAQARAAREALDRRVAELNDAA